MSTGFMTQLEYRTVCPRRPFSGSLEVNLKQITPDLQAPSHTGYVVLQYGKAERLAEELRKSVGPGQLFMVSVNSSKDPSIWETELILE